MSEWRIESIEAGLPDGVVIPVITPEYPAELTKRVKAALGIDGKLSSYRDHSETVFFFRPRHHAAIAVAHLEAS